MVKIMEEEIRELKKTINELEEELSAEMQRREVEEGASKSNGKGGLKQKIKESPIGKVIADPNSVAGKVLRAPRTIYRIVRHPGVLKDILVVKEEVREEGSLFVPIRFYRSDYNGNRVNVVMEKFDPEMMKAAVQMVKKNGGELRVITCSEGVATMKYKRMVEKKEIQKLKEISFYSSFDQQIKRTVFELEVGKNDVFLTKAWANGQE